MEIKNDSFTPINTYSQAINYLKGKNEEFKKILIFPESFDHLMMFLLRDFFTKSTRPGFYVDKKSIDDCGSTCEIKKANLNIEYVQNIDCTKHDKFIFLTCDNEAVYNVNCLNIKVLDFSCCEILNLFNTFTQITNPNPKKIKWIELKTYNQAKEYCEKGGWENIQVFPTTADDIIIHIFQCFFINSKTPGFYTTSDFDDCPCGITWIKNRTFSEEHDKFIVFTSDDTIIENENCLNIKVTDLMCCEIADFFTTFLMCHNIIS